MSERKLLSQINVTPFVDVMLVLLIIFMVTAPMLEQGIDLDLPEVKAAAIKPSAEPLTISINKKGVVYISNKKTTIKDLKTKLTAIKKRMPDQSIILKADKNVKYGRVAQTIAAIKEAGINKVAMITNPVEEK